MGRHPDALIVDLCDEHEEALEDGARGRKSWRQPCPYCRARVEVRRGWVEAPKLHCYGFKATGDVDFVCPSCGASGAGAGEWNAAMAAAALPASELPPIPIDSSAELLGAIYTHADRERALARAARALLRLRLAPGGVAVLVRAWAAQHLVPALDVGVVERAIEVAAFEQAARERGDA